MTDKRIQTMPLTRLSAIIALCTIVCAAAFGQIQPVQNKIESPQTDKNVDPDKETLTFDKNLVTRKVFQLKHVKPSQLGQVLEPLLGKKGYLSTNDQTNTLIIYDNNDILRRIEPMIQKFDVNEASLADNGGIFEVSNSDPKEIAQLINKILKGQADANSASPAFAGRSNQTTRTGTETRATPQQQSPDETRISESTQKNKQVQGMDYETISLIYIDANEASEKLIEILSKIGGDYAKNITIQPQFEPKQLLIFGNETYRQIAKNILNEIDKEKYEYPLEFDIFTIKYADVEELAGSINSIMDNWSTDYTHNISVYPLKPTSQILVFGKKPNRDMVKKLIQEVDLPQNPTKKEDSIFPNKEVEDKEYEIIQTLYLQVPKAAAKLNEIIQKTDPNYVNKIYIEPLTSARQLMLFGDEQARQFVKNLLEQIDLPPDYLRHDTILLRYIKPEKAVEVFDEIFSNSNIEYKKTIFVDEPNDQLFVYGNEKFRKFISDVAKEIDNHSFAKAQEYNIIPIKDANIADVVSSLRNIMRDWRINVSDTINIVPISETKQLLIFGDKDYCDMIRKLIKECPLPENQLQRSTFKLNYADPNKLALLIKKVYGKYDKNMISDNNRISGDTVITISFPLLKQIVVLASEENMRQITNLINLCDRKNPEETGRVLIDVQILEVSDEFLERIGLDSSSLETSDKWLKYRLNDSNSPDTYIIDEHAKDSLKNAADESEWVINEKTFSHHGDSISLEFPVKESRVFPVQFLKNDIRNYATTINITTSISEKENGIRLNGNIVVRRIKNITIKKSPEDSMKIVPEIENTNYNENLEVLISSGDSLLIKGPEFISFDEVSNKRHAGEINGTPEIKGTYIGYPDRRFAIKKRTELILIKLIYISWK